MTSSNNPNDIDLDQLIANAVKEAKEEKEDKKALDLLRFGLWFTTFLKGLSARVAYEFDLNLAIEIRDAVFDKVSTSIQNLRMPNQPGFMAWCETIAKSFCLNYLRHFGVEKNHSERVAASERMKGTRISAEGNSIPLPFTDGNSPEEHLLEKEAAALREEKKSDLYLEVQKQLLNSSPTDIYIVFYWGVGMKLKQIAEKTGIPIATVQRRLTAWQKRVLITTDLQPIIDKNPEHRKGAFELIRNAVTELNCAA